MYNEMDIVLGIDGGGTHTRIVAATLNGTLLAYVEKGGSSPSKNANAEQNVKTGMEEAIRKAGRAPHHVKMVTAGLASLDSEKDLEWAKKLTNLADLSCERLHVNDSVVAQYGAFIGDPGIIVISGTGSILFAVNEAGKQIRNYDFHHYAYSASRFLSDQAVFEIMAGNSNASDDLFIDQVLRFWNVVDVAELCKLGAQGFHEDRIERNRLFGNMGPLVTNAAWQGSRLAKSICDRAVHEIVVGVELLGTSFQGDHIPVAYIGSVVNSPYFKQTLTDALHSRQNKRFTARKPVLSPARGAVLMALDRLGINIDDSVILRLQEENLR